MLSTKLKEAAGNSADATLYVDDVFSTWLYTGNGSTQTITNGIDLAGKGGMVWGATRTGTGFGNNLFSTNVGVGNYLETNSTSGVSTSNGVTSFNSNGFTLGSNSLNQSGNTFVTWTFRKAAKFFDVVTYTGTGSARTIAHSLGVAPGMVIVKRTDTTGDWQVYSNGLTSAAYSIQLNLTNAQASAPTVWNSTAPTSSVFSVGTDATVNASGGTYVAYLYAHDTSATGIIQCGSYTGNGSATGPVVTLGWEPQYLMVKVSNGTTGGWILIDSMRGMPVGSADAVLFANSAALETNVEYLSPTATGFQITSTAGQINTSGATYIYMAIRRPNKPPTSGTQVFNPTYLYQYDINGNLSSGNGIHGYLGSVSDFYIQLYLTGNVLNSIVRNRLTNSNYLITSSTAAETAGTVNFWDNNKGSGFVTANSVNTTISTLNFKRAPGFFDVVCWTGTNSTAKVLNHNLTVAPEFIITKERSVVGLWYCNLAMLGANSYATLNTTNEARTNIANLWGGSLPTSTTFTVNENAIYSASSTVVAYLFATLAGISKVGSYTGNGTGQAIACGFSAGARFVLIKRTDSTGDWYTFDSARGLTSGSSPYLLLNSTAAETTGNNGVYASTGGFTLGSTASTTTNINGASYIYLSVA